MSPTRLRHRMGQTKDFRKIHFSCRSYNHTFDLVSVFSTCVKIYQQKSIIHDFILDKVSYDSIINRTTASEPPTLAHCYQWCFDWEPFEGAASE